jgi:hypothetical protein
MLLFVLIPAAWLGVSLLVLAICRMAAQGDATPTPARMETPCPRVATRQRRRLRTGSRLASHGRRAHTLS